MSYINFEILFKRGLIPHDLLFLQAVKQQKTEDTSEYIAILLDDERYEVLEEMGLVHQIKGNNSMSHIERMRVTSKGNKFLSEISIAGITEGDIQMYEYLSEMYLKEYGTDRTIGNKKKTKIYCAIFRKHLNLTLREMYWLCWMFLEEYEYTKVLEYIFFNNNKNRYGKFENNIEDSPLYQFYDENKDRVKLLWKKNMLL
jgi:hypothetical protein